MTRFAALGDREVSGAYTGRPPRGGRIRTWFLPESSTQAPCLLAKRITVRSCPAAGPLQAPPEPVWVAHSYTSFAGHARRILNNSPPVNLKKLLSDQAYRHIYGVNPVRVSRCKVRGRVALYL
jgi:hypothetical protein